MQSEPMSCRNLSDGNKFGRELKKAFHTYCFVDEPMEIAFATVYYEIVEGNE